MHTSVVYCGMGDSLFYVLEKKNWPLNPNHIMQ